MTIIVSEIMIQGLKLLDVICTSTMYECSRRNHALLLSLPRQLYVTSKFRQLVNYISTLSSTAKPKRRAETDEGGDYGEHNVIMLS